MVNDQWILTIAEKKQSQLEERVGFLLGKGGRKKQKPSQAKPSTAAIGAFTFLGLWSRSSVAARNGAAKRLSHCAKMEENIQRRGTAKALDRATTQFLEHSKGADRLAGALRGHAFRRASTSPCVGASLATSNGPVSPTDLSGKEFGESVRCISSFAAVPFIHA